MSQSNSYPNGAKGCRRSRGWRRLSGYKGYKGHRGHRGHRGYKVDTRTTGDEDLTAVLDLTREMGTHGSSNVIEPTIIVNNFDTQVLTNQTVQPGQAFILSTNPVVNGTAVTHAARSSTISLAPNQTYQVRYTLSIQNTSGMNTIMRPELRLNGISILRSDVITPVIPGSIIATATNVVIMSTGSGVNDLTLINNGPGEVRTLRSDTGSISVVKLDDTRLYIGHRKPSVQF